MKELQEDSFFLYGLPKKICDAWMLVKESFASRSLSFFPNYAQMIFCKKGRHAETHKKLQQTLTAAADLLTAARLTTDEERAIAHSQSDSGASSRLLTVPSSASLTLPPEACRTANKMVTNTLSLPNQHCICGEKLVLSHILGCRHLRSVKTRHDVLVTLAQGLAREAGFVVRREVMCVPGTSKRMDIVFYHPTSRAWRDLSVVNPLAPSYVGEACRSGGAAARARESNKMSKWRAVADEQKIEFQPIVFETTGRLGPSAQHFLTQVTEQACKTTTDYLPTKVATDRWKARFRRQATQQFSNAMAYANHLIIEEAIQLSNTGKTESQHKLHIKQMRERTRSHRS